MFVVASRLDSPVSSLAYHVNDLVGKFFCLHCGDVGNLNLASCLYGVEDTDL